MRLLVSFLVIAIIAFSGISLYLYFIYMPVKDDENRVPPWGPVETMFDVHPKHLELGLSESSKIDVLIRNEEQDTQSHTFIVNVLVISETDSNIDEWITIDTAPILLAFNEEAHRDIYVNVPVSSEPGTYTFFAFACMDKSIEECKSIEDSNFDTPTYFRIMVV